MRTISIPLHIKVGFTGVFIARTCFPDEKYITCKLTNNQKEFESTSLISYDAN